MKESRTLTWFLASGLALLVLAMALELRTRQTVRPLTAVSIAVVAFIALAENWRQRKR